MPEDKFNSNAKSPRFSTSKAIGFKGGQLPSFQQAAGVNPVAPPTSPKPAPTGATVNPAISQFEAPRVSQPRLVGTLATAAGSALAGEGVKAGGKYLFGDRAPKGSAPVENRAPVEERRFDPNVARNSFADGFGAGAGTLDYANMIGSSGGDSMGALLATNADNWGINIAPDLASQFSDFGASSVGSGAGAGAEAGAALGETSAAGGLSSLGSYLGPIGVMTGAMGIMNALDPYDTPGSGSAPTGTWDSMAQEKGYPTVEAALTAGYNPLSGRMMTTEERAATAAWQPPEVIAPGDFCVAIEETFANVGADPNGPEAQALRGFAATKASSTPEGMQFMQIYGDVAPQLIATVNQLPNAQEIWKQNYTNYISQASLALQNGDEQRAGQLVSEAMWFLISAATESTAGQNMTNDLTQLGSLVDKAFIEGRSDASQNGPEAMGDDRAEMGMNDEAMMGGGGMMPQQGADIMPQGQSPMMQQFARQRY